MRKYLTILTTTINQYFVYRLSFILWRFRAVLSVLLLYFLWNGVFAGRTHLFGYSPQQIITYVLLTNVLGAIVLATRTPELSNEILNGNIINYLLKPMNLISFISMRELADKTLNTVFAVLEIILLVLIFQPSIFIQTNLLVIPVMIFCIAIGVIISFFISLSLSLMAFWTTELWGPRFIFIMLATMLSGSVFPLDILPKPFYSFLLFTPFPYLTYLPVKVYLHGLTPDIIQPMILGVIWCIVLYVLTIFLLRKGMRDFSFFGR